MICTQGASFVMLIDHELRCIHNMKRNVSIILNYWGFDVDLLRFATGSGLFNLLYHMKSDKKFELWSWNFLRKRPRNSLEAAGHEENAGKFL